MTSKHTPGPWQSTKHANLNNFTTTGPRSEIDGLPEIIAFGIQDEANARLIAAAPDLLAALENAAIAAYSKDATRDECQALIKRVHANDWDDARRIAAANARAAIAKARGEA